MTERVRLKPKNEPIPVPSPALQVVPCGPPPVIHGEDREIYDKVVERVFGDFKPHNYFEEKSAIA